MKNRYWIISAIFIFLSGCTTSQKATPKEFTYRVEDAPDWNRVFIRDSGWFGADGIFAIPLSVSNRTESIKQVIIFSDTMFGKIEAGQLQKGYKMLNNSVAFIEGIMPDTGKISFPFPMDSAQSPQSIFPMLLPDAEDGEYYWLGDGYVNSADGNTYIFAYRVIDRLEWTEEQFKFEILGGACIIFPAGSVFPYADQKQIKLPFFADNDRSYTSFGAAVFENTEEANAPNADGYIYVYGVRDPNKEVLVARLRPQDMQVFDQWQFWDGKDWTASFENTVAIADSASNELSVSALPNGQYAMIFQLKGIYPTVCMRRGETPWGPFGEIEEIWDCEDALEEREFFTYNAKGHPSLSRPGELVVSYNVNSFAFWDQIEQYPHLYRPRFFRIIFE